MLQVAPCSVHNVMHIRLYTAVVVVDAHVTKYQVVGIIRTMIRVDIKGACLPYMPRLPQHLVGQACCSGSTHRVHVLT